MPDTSAQKDRNNSTRKFPQRGRRWAGRQIHHPSSVFTGQANLQPREALKHEPEWLCWAPGLCWAVPGTRALLGCAEHQGSAGHPGCAEHQGSAEHQCCAGHPGCAEHQGCDGHQGSTELCWAQGCARHHGHTGPMVCRNTNPFCAHLLCMTPSGAGLSLSLSLSLFLVCSVLHGK